MSAPRFYTAEQPWFPPEQPVEFPDRVTPKWVGNVAKSRSVDVVVRSHLVPLHASSNAYKGAWRTFWRALAFADRQGVVDLLTRWQADAETALADPAVSDEDAAIIRRFSNDAAGAVNRINRAKEEPMAWAGADFAKYPPEVRVMVETLIGGYDLHRAGEISDSELYRILSAMAVDPQDSPTGIAEETRRRIRESARTGQAPAVESVYRKS